MDDAKKDLFWVILLLFALALVWYYTGGPSRPSATSGPFLKEPLETRQQELRRDTRQATDEGFDEKLDEPTKESAYKYKATLRVGSGAKKSDPQEEYIEIRASSKNEEALNISQWSLEGVTGLDIKLGKGSYLPYSGRINARETIFLKPGEKAYIVTGESPVGTSFRVNKCTGYFGQFQDFTPRLPTQCPYPREEDLPGNLDDDCLDYIDRLPRCEAPMDIPWELQASCQNHINEKVNYSACVETHKNDSDFYKSEWRIFLGRNQELWKNRRETIILYDENEKIIDWASY